MGAVCGGKGFGFGVEVSEDGGGIGADDEIADAIGREIESTRGLSAGKHSFNSREGFDDRGDARLVGRFIQIDVRQATKAEVLLRIFVALGGYGEFDGSVAVGAGFVEVPGASFEVHAVVSGDVEGGIGCHSGGLGKFGVKNLQDARVTPERWAGACAWGNRSYGHRGYSDRAGWLNDR